MAEEPAQRSGISHLIAMGKDLVALLRDSSLFCLAILLIVFPTTFNSILVEAGFEEGSVVGFKWRSKLVETDTALKEARATISALQERNDEMAKALADAQARLVDPALKERITRLEQDNNRQRAATQQVQTSVSRTIASNAVLVEKALLLTGGNTWGVVFSGDATLEGAKYEIDVVAPKLGLPNAAIYLRQGSYRSVSVVGDKEEAEGVLPRARKRRRDAYVVNMSAWCPGATQKGGYFECETP